MRGSRLFTTALILVAAGFATTAQAGTITGISVSEGSTETTVSTTYTFTFTPATSINSGNWCDGVYFWFDFDDDYTVSGATLGSITPSTGMSINNRNDSNGQIRMYGNGSISAGTEYTVVINGVQNPATAQTPVNHQIRTGEGCSIVDSGSVAAAEITAASSNPPVVQSQIADYGDLQESAGLVQYVANLNDHFLDSDGDTISYSAVSSDSTIVSVSLSGTDNRTLSLQAHRYGDATITVTGTTSDGSVDDQFTVHGIGALPIASVSQGSTETTDFTSYTFVFTPESSINNGNWSDGAYFTFDLDNDYVVSSATLGSITPSVNGMGINFQSDSTALIRMYTNSGSIVGGQQYTVVINNIQNPATAQTPVNHVIYTGDGADVVDTGSIAAAAITEAATNPPVVDSMIPDKNNLSTSEGQIVYIPDLNDHFVDVDGDVMSFSASSSDNGVVLASTSGTNGIVLSLEAVAYGTATVTVTATSVDGSVQDEFVVTTAGSLVLSDVTQSTTEAGATGQVSFTFTPDTTINQSMWCDGAYFFIDFDDDYTVSGASLVSVNPGVTGMAINGLFDSTGGIRMYTGNAAAQITGGQEYTVVINGVQNPPVAQQPEDYLVRTGEGCGAIDSGSAVESGTLPAPLITAASLADFNADDHDDILWRNYSNGANAIWLMTGTSYTSTVNLPPIGNTDYVMSGTGDFNSDGSPDIVWRNEVTGANAIWLLNGTSYSSTVNLPALTNTAYVIGGSGDFNSDGVEDIVWRNQATGANAIWIMNGTAYDSTVNLPALGNTNFRIVGVADFDNDLDPDIVLRNQSNGQVSLWVMNGTNVASIVNLPAVPNSDMQIQGMADYDSDSDADILWRNMATGLNAVWIMNGTSYSSTVNLPALPNLQYEMGGPK